MVYGPVIPLLYIQVEFRNKYKIPIFLEESLSFGVLGRTGRGAVEHFDLSVSIPPCMLEMYNTALCTTAR